MKTCLVRTVELSAEIYYSQCTPYVDKYKYSHCRRLVFMEGTNIYLKKSICKYMQL